MIGPIDPYRFGQCTTTRPLLGDAFGLQYFSWCIDKPEVFNRDKALVSVCFVKESATYNILMCACMHVSDSRWPSLWDTVTRLMEAGHTDHYLDRRECKVHEGGFLCQTITQIGLESVSQDLVFTIDSIVMNHVPRQWSMTIVICD